MFHGIDLSSDTATKPTEAMKKAMFEAEVGDEQKNEDPTTIKLENMISDMLGFSDAVFLPSATMANQIAISALTHPGEELIAADSSHVLNAESGGPAIHAHVMSRPITTHDGTFSASALEEAFRGKSIPRRTYSSLLSIENTTNLGGGFPWPKLQLKSILERAKKLNLKTHMDGARFFNACIATQERPSEIAKGFDMISICLSKGLGCPVGALLIFKPSYYDKVIKLKHLMGGAMRQSGILAAAGVYALQHHIDRLEEDHDNAKILAMELSCLAPHIEVKNVIPSTNIVLFEWKNQKYNADEFHTRCQQNGLRFSHMSHNLFRAVTHLNISSTDIKQAMEIINGHFKI